MDPGTGIIWRLSDDVTEIPGRFIRRHVWGTTDYDWVTIETSRFLVFFGQNGYAESEDGATTRVEWTIYNYHKFGADSSITYGTKQ